jgi:F1F0 ATPase subunit 2
MNELNEVMLFLSAGFGLGIFYFGGLWLTVRFLPSVRIPVLLSTGSLFIRAGVSFGVLYLLIRGGEPMMLIPCIIGFVLVKIIMVLSIGRFRVVPRSSLKE